MRHTDSGTWLPWPAYILWVMRYRPERIATAQERRDSLKRELAEREGKRAKKR